MRKKWLSAGVLAAVLGFSALAASAQAYRGDPGIQGPNYSPERHEAMLQAFEDRDYEAWASLMQGRGRVTQVVNESNFDKFAEAHELAMHGDTEEARQIRQELGLRAGCGMGWQNRENR